MYQGAWSGQRVMERLEEAFREAQGRPIYSPAANILLPVEGPIDGLDLIMATAHFLGRESRDRVWLLTRARCAAQDCSVRSYCRNLGISRVTFYRRTNEVAEKIADALNARHDLTLVPTSAEA